METFKDIKGYEGLYQVSDLGRVKSLKRKHVLVPKILKYNKDTGGYAYVRLYKNNKSVCPKVHRLVLTAFVPNTENKRCVNHKDFNLFNNCVENLEWVTDKSNAYYKRATKNGTSKFKGVSLQKKSNRWVAQIQKDRTNHYLGTFNTEKEAALAYNREAQKLFGKFAYLNIVCA